jgi:hypothetical protein
MSSSLLPAEIRKSHPALSTHQCCFGSAEFVGRGTSASLRKVFGSIILSAPSGTPRMEGTAKGVHFRCAVIPVGRRVRGCTASLLIVHDDDGATVVLTSWQEPKAVIALPHRWLVNKTGRGRTMDRFYKTPLDHTFRPLAFNANS